MWRQSTISYYVDGDDELSFADDMNDWEIYFVLSVIKQKGKQDVDNRIVGK